MRSSVRLFAFLLVVSAEAALAKSDAIRRLSPLPEPAQPPAACTFVSIQKDSPAEKAGIEIGDTIKMVNGSVPKDATGVAALVSASTATMDVVVTSPAKGERRLQVALRATRPRLGAVCDLTGWRQLGVTAAGNESVTLFGGPFSFTGSGILDKGLVFMRVRVTNNSNLPVQISSASFSAKDAAGAPLKGLAPLDVMCVLYGDKGAHLLALKKKTKDTMDPDTGPHEESEAICPAGTGAGRLASSKLEFAQANADYVAQESLWPASFAPGATADGLIYFPEPTGLPLTIEASVADHHFSVRFGMPQPSTLVMKQEELDKFFEAQKKGTPLRLTLRKGRVFVGKFSSYDVIDEKVWFDTPSGHLLNSTSFPLATIQSAEAIEQIPAKPQPVNEHLN